VLAKGALIMSDLPNNDIESVNPTPDNVELELKRAQLQKLDLEIKNLEPKRKWYEQFIPFIPLISVALSVAGFGWGVLMFLNQQEKDRLTREEERISRDQAQYRSSYEQLLQFSSNPNITVQRVLFLRADMDRLIDSVFAPDQRVAEKQKLRETIFGLISRECDFTQAKHVRLDIAALQEWKDYEEELRTVPNKRYLNKYLNAIAYLHTRDPRYIESAEYNPQTGFTESHAPKEPLAMSFASLIEGFNCHLQLIDHRDPERQAQIDAFERVTKNPFLTADLFRSDTSGLFTCKP
jgi:hypothetical protein